MDHLVKGDKNLKKQNLLECHPKIMYLFSPNLDTLWLISGFYFGHGYLDPNLFITWTFFMSIVFYYYVMVVHILKPRK